LKDDDHPGRPHTAVTDYNIKEVRDVIWKDRRLGVRAVAEEVVPFVCGFLIPCLRLFLLTICFIDMYCLNFPFIPHVCMFRFHIKFSITFNTMFWHHVCFLFMLIYVTFCLCHIHYLSLLFPILLIYFSAF
jgi:hypothetical protein